MDDDDDDCFATPTLQNPRSHRVTEEDSNPPWDSNERLALALRAAAIGSWSYECSTGWFSADGGYSAAHGYDPNAIVSTIEDAFATVHADDRARVMREFAQAIESAAKFESHYRVVLADGTVRWIQSTSGVTNDRTHRVGFTWDITAQKQTEEELARVIRCRSDIFSMLAHDLRSPVSTILMQTMLVRRGADDGEKRGVREIEPIERAAQRLNRTIHDLVDVVQAESGELDIVRVRVVAADLIAEVVQANRETAGSRSIEIRSDVSENLPPLWADRERLRRVFDNLIANAMKLTAQGTICVGARRADAAVEFWVESSCQGIAEDQLAQVFELYPQGGCVRAGGGLGLVTVKRIVEAHLGHVSVQRRNDSNARLRFTVPVSTQF